jgi:hypothetical protein
MATNPLKGLKKLTPIIGLVLLLVGNRKRTPFVTQQFPRKGTVMTEISDEFLFLPAQSGTGVLARRTEIAGARPNGPSGNTIVYLKSGPSLYVGMAPDALARELNARIVVDE